MGEERRKGTKKESDVSGACSSRGRARAFGGEKEINPRSSSAAIS